MYIILTCIIYKYVQIYVYIYIFIMYTHIIAYMYISALWDIYNHYGLPTNITAASPRIEQICQVFFSLESAALRLKF